MTAPPQFIDLSHHLSPETLARKVNPLKDIIRVVTNNPQLISLANGKDAQFLRGMARLLIRMLIQETRTIRSTRSAASTMKSPQPLPTTQSGSGKHSALQRLPKF